MDTNNLPKRKHTRLQQYDYNDSGAYFITICTQNRRCLLSRINVQSNVPDDPQSVQLLPYGEIAKNVIEHLNQFYDDISVDMYVIMPNHIHILLIVSNSGTSGTPYPTKQNSTLSRFVSTLKRFCNRQYGQNIWQKSYNDHIIRNKEDYQQHIQYIYQNPMQWYFDELFVEE